MINKPLCIEIDDFVVVCIRVFVFCMSLSCFGVQRFVIMLNEVDYQFC